MKNLMFMAITGVAVFGMVGCTMFGANKKEQGDVISKYQKERMSLEIIASGLSNSVPIVATAFHPIAALTAGLYIPVAKEVDEVADLTKGRRPYIGYVNDVKALTAQGKTTEQARKEILSKVNSETQVLIQKYFDYLNKSDLDGAKERLTITLKAITNETGNMANKLAELLKNPGITQLGALDQLRASKTLKGDFGKLGSQLGDAGTGVNLLLNLNSQDKEAKGYMKDYPLS